MADAIKGSSIDTSIYGQIKGPQQIDIGALINTARAAQQLQGESALGDIYKQAIDPTTGEVNAGKLGTLAPRAGVLAPQIAQQSQALAQGQQAIDFNKLNNDREWWKRLDSHLYKHINDPDLTHSKVLDSVHELIGHQNSNLQGGMFSPQLATQATAWLWGPDGKPLPPDQIRKKLGQFHTQVLDALQASEYVPIGVDPSTGEQLFMTRAGAIAKDAALPRGGAGSGAAAPPGAGRPGGAPPARAGGAPVAPPASTPGVVPQPGGAPAMASSLPLGGAESAQEMRADLSRQGQFAQNIYPAQEALRTAKELQAKYGAGILRPGSHGWQEFKSMAYGVWPWLAEKAGVDPNELTDYTKIDKYATQAAQRRSAAFGGHTDQQLATTLRATPHVGMNDLAFDELMSANIALDRAEYAQVQQSAKFGGPAYTAKKSEWASQNDIRAFSLDLLSPEARAKLLGSLKKGTPEYERFQRSLQAAYDTGVMDRPGATETVAPRAPGAPKIEDRVPGAPPRAAAPSGARVLGTIAPASGNMPLPSILSEPAAAAPATLGQPPIPGARPGRRSDGSPAWHVSQGGRYYEVVPV